MRAGFQATGLVLLILLAVWTTGGVDRKAAVVNRKANQAFGAKKFDEAASLYNEALTRAPESAEISYNLGNAMYRRSQYADAAQELRRALDGKDPALRQQSFFNLGNTFYK